MLKRIPGTKDILPKEVLAWQQIEKIAHEVFPLYNYQEIRLPLIEDESLFNRSLGASTEIIQKQMFVIKRDKDIYALRPEATASVVRAYLENGLDKTEGFAKLYYLGPMFRAERPQKGRLRQFHHLGCEAIGSKDAFLDVEVIDLADRLLKRIGIDGYELKINTLGCLKDKETFVKILRSELKDKAGSLCADCQRRLKVNVLRVLDCKNEPCIKLVKGLNIKHGHLCAECKSDFSIVQSGLSALGINYQVDPCLVRGLDYYTRTVFEIKHSLLGSQDALGAGGRYDHLVKELGGEEKGAIGFALGVERLLLVNRKELGQPKNDLVYLITLGDIAKNKGLELLAQLRQAGIRTDTDYEGKSLKAAMRNADSLGARYVLILGEDELRSGTICLKDMAAGKQEQIQIDNITRELKC